jgi:hypothetical protein
MVRTRQGARTDPSPVRGSDQSLNYESDPDWDPLADTSSHVPATSVNSKRGKSRRLRDDSLSHQADVSMPEVSDRQGGDNIPPPVAPVDWSNPFLDPAFMDHIVRAIAVGMATGASSTTLRSGGVVTIVQWVKGMREMGCMTYHGEEDAEVVEHWLRKMERVINQMHVPKELQVDCLTQLLIESAHSWWETIRERRSWEVLRWRDFREEFEERYYSWEHRREKEQEFLDLRQGDLTILEYERRFQYLAAFPSTYLPTERHRVERFCDGPG